MQELHYQGNPQELLQQLIDRTQVSLFEITRPSLHEIFVRIAAPEKEVDFHAMA
jgi:ABC-2 type transport system ATP-binding protein